MAEKTEITTPLSQWTNAITSLVVSDFESNGIEFDEYSRKCAMAAMGSIFQLAKTEGFDLKAIDRSNLRDVVGQCASLKLNPAAQPRECYFQTRKKKVGTDYVTVIEMGIEGDGNDAILRNFGQDVKRVYPCWIVKEGDIFTYPKRKGLLVEPPSWEEKGLSERMTRVVYPILLNDNSVIYLIAERESVKVNLFAHVRNNLMNETFGICENRYKATIEQKKQIDARKEEIYEALRRCETLDDMLACELARPYISAAWLDTPESMIVRKARNNAIKKYAKNYNIMARSAYMELDETYQAARLEAEEKANSEAFVEGEGVFMPADK